MRFRKLMMDCAGLASGKEPDAVRCAERYHVCAGASVHKRTDLASVMVERFGDPTGYVGGSAWAPVD